MSLSVSKNLFGKVNKKRLLLIVVLGVIMIAAALGIKALRKNPVVQAVRGLKTVDSVMAMYGDAAHERLKPHFEKAGLSYPPAQLLMLGLKAEESLEIYASNKNSEKLKFVWRYPIIGNSGVLGPKLKEGDRQMPEGFYKIQELEPNSLYHVALRVNYPSDFDKEKGALEGRTELGSDIMIHGSNCSIGCLAMGDPASEELFALVHDVGLNGTELLLSPVDFRNPPKDVRLPDKPSWIAGVYEELKKRILELPAS